MKINREAYIEGIRDKRLELYIRQLLSESRVNELFVGESIIFEKQELRIKNKVLKHDTKSVTIIYNLIIL